MSKLLTFVGLILAVSTPRFAFSYSDECSQLFLLELSTLETAKQMIAASRTESGAERNKFFREEPHFVRIRVGMPATLRLVPSEGKVFRHYTTKSRLQEILKTKMLQASWTPFYYSAFMVDYNEDLTGVFITTPEFKANQVGVREENASFIDFKLPANTGILYIRDGVLLIPGTPTAEPWKVRLYQSEDRKYHQDHAEEFARWDREGIPQPLTVSIEVVGHSELYPRQRRPE